MAKVAVGTKLYLYSAVPQQHYYAHSLASPNPVGSRNSNKMSQLEESPMFMQSCRDCTFCDGLAEKPEKTRSQDDVDKGASTQPITERASFM
ncbi:4890_t:CDS:2, partial [Acaulospora colombiana]